jgi:hypothetical protein
MDSVPESNQRKKGEGNAKNGNKYLVSAFIESANFAQRAPRGQAATLQSPV